MKDYSQYELEDYLTDEDFIDWVKYPDEKRNQIWNNLMAHTEQREKIQSAVSALNKFQFKEEDLPETFYSSLKADIDSTITNKDQDVNKPKNFRLATWLKVAAVFVGVIGITLLYNSLRSPATITLTTFFKEIKTFELPDHSLVTLNANSSLEYPKNWNDDNRKVTLKGEGFFNIKHIEDQKGASRFIVQANKVDIEVLGTEFNVKNNDDKTAVMLRSGKVRLSIQATKEMHVMQPTDYAVYDEATKKVNVSTVNPSYHTAWLNHKYIFEKTSLTEVCKHLKDFYGLQFLIKEEKLAKQEISGTLFLGDEKSVLQTLSSLLNAKIQQQGQQITISSK